MLNLGRISLVLLFFPLTLAAAEARLNWTPPTRNTDGTALTNLAGYVIQHRQKGTTTWKVRNIPYPGQTTAVIRYLPAGATWQFRMKSFNNLGVRSNPTAIVEKKLL